MQLKDPYPDHLVAGSRDAAHATEVRRPLLLVGLDGSTTGWRAAAYAIGQARQQHGRLVFVYVVNPTAPFWVGSEAPVTAALLANAERVQAEIAATLTTALHQLNLPWEFRRSQGRPVVELARLADKLHADAVIVGASHRRTRWTGSLTSRLTRSCHWPITVVP
jgi:nucleotide-binding universal stress UspA family protein